jgi:hypothetical protein
LLSLWIFPESGERVHFFGLRRGGDIHIFRLRPGSVLSFEDASLAQNEHWGPAIVQELEGEVFTGIEAPLDEIAISRFLPAGRYTFFYYSDLHFLITKIDGALVTKLEVLCALAR